MTTARRRFLISAATLSAVCTWPQVQAQTAPAQRQFNPQPGAWRTFEVTTRVDIQQAEGQTRVWLPVPSIDSDWQRSVASHYASNGQARMNSDAVYGARLLQVEFTPGKQKPWVELTSRIQTRNRAVDWAAKKPVLEDAGHLRFWTQPTALLPTDGIVRKTALEATRGAKTDVEKARALYVGLCRAVGLPARDVYGLRLLPSAFGYKELSGNPASLRGAQHCRAEVWLKDHGWVAMVPADVAKVMRLETAEWIKDTQHPVVAPVNRALFGARGPRLGFLMYPVCETADERLDAYSPDAFKYQITARELTV